MNTAICRITKPEPLVTDLTFSCCSSQGLLRPVYVWVIHTKINQGSVCSSSVHTGSQTGTAGLPWDQDPAMLLNVNTWTWSRHFFNAFLVINITPFWQEPVIHHSRTASSHAVARLTRIQFFFFRLQKILIPIPCIFLLTLLGRKCLSSAVPYHVMALPVPHIPSLRWSWARQATWQQTR